MYSAALTMQDVGDPTRSILSPRARDRLSEAKEK